MKTATKENSTARKVTFRWGTGSRTGTIRNPQASVGSVADRLAKQIGISGAFQVLRDGEPLSPDTPLREIPGDEIVLDLVPSLTPASRKPR
jgi:hypothetical protein